jgi:MFS family permease
MQSRPSAITSFLRQSQQIPGAVWTLGFVSLLMDVSSEMIHALLPVYLVTVLGTSTLTVGIIEGTAEATASVVKVFSGAFSDWLGKRKLLATLGYGLAAFAKPVFPLASSAGWVIAARFIDRVGKGIRGAPRDALIADITPANLRGASFGLRQSLDTVGAVLGPLTAIGLMWATADHFVSVFWTACVPAFLSFALILLAVREPHRAAELPRVRMPLSRDELGRLGGAYWWLIVVATIFSLARFSEAFMLLRAQSVGLPVMLVPLVMVVMNVVYALAAYPAGALSDSTSRTTMLIIGLFALLAADFVLVFATDATAVAFGAALWGLHLGFTQGLFAAMVADTAPADLRGTGYGVFNLVTGLALLLASVVAGALWDAAGPRWTFAAGAAFVLLTLVGLIAARHRLR